MRRHIDELLEDLAAYYDDLRSRMLIDAGERGHYTDEDRAVFRARNWRVRQVRPAVGRLPQLIRHAHRAFCALVAEALLHEDENDLERSVQLFDIAENLADELEACGCDRAGRWAGISVDKD